MVDCNPPEIFSYISTCSLDVTSLCFTNKATCAVSWIHLSVTKEKLGWREYKPYLLYQISMHIYLKQSWLFSFWLSNQWVFLFYAPLHLIYRSLLGLIGSMFDHSSLPPKIEFLHWHIWRVFHHWLRFIVFLGHLAHLAYHVHKSVRKTSIIFIRFNISNLLVIAVSKTKSASFK